MKFETVYKRKMNSSYMILWGEMDSPLYEIVMQQRNTIRGLLKLEVIVADGVEQYWYDITGKRSLDTYLKSRTLDGRLLLTLLSQLNQVQEEAGHYLLAQERISLEPEYIFFDNNEEKLYFTFCPAIHKEQAMHLTELMEYLLQKIDHTDQVAVKIGYEVYQKSVEENSSLSQILDAIKGSSGERTVKVEDREEPKESKESKDRLESKSREEPKNRLESYIREAEKEQSEKAEHRIKFQFPGKIRFFKAKGGKEEPKVVFGPADAKEEEPEYHPTQYLGIAEAKENIQGILKYEGEKEQEDMTVDREIYVIGSRREGVDGVIHAESVSRIHAQIYHQPDGYYVEDLNSRNGTTLNGRLLDYKEKTRLEAGDVIMFASESYRFQ